MYVVQRQSERRDREAVSTAVVDGTATPSTSSWWRILLLGLGLFALAVVVFGVTGNPNLFPTVALIGNFLVPVSYVAFFYERRHMSQVTLVSTARAFLYGGVLGVFAASLLEPVFIRQLTFVSAFEVGVDRGVREDHRRDRRRPPPSA